MTQALWPDYKVPETPAWLAQAIRERHPRLEVRLAHSFELKPSIADFIKSKYLRLN